MHIEISDDGREGLLPPLPPDCDPPGELPDKATAERAIVSWAENAATLAPAVRGGMIGVFVAQYHAATIVANGIPEAVSPTVREAVQGLEEMKSQIGYAAALCLGRLIDRYDGKFCPHQIACEAVRLVQLMVSEHVRRHLRRAYPDQDYWRTAVIVALFSSHAGVFYGGSSAGKRMLDRVAGAVPAAAAGTPAGGRL